MIVSMATALGAQDIQIAPLNHQLDRQRSHHAAGLPMDLDLSAWPLTALTVDRDPLWAGTSVACRNH
jgi:hypothetical protein